MPNKKKTFSAGTVAKIDRITAGMLQQLDLQTQAASELLAHAPEDQRDAMLARIADVHGRLVKLRAGILGSGATVLAAGPRDDSRGQR